MAKAKDKIIGQDAYDALPEAVRDLYIEGPEEASEKTWVLDSEEASGLKAQIKAKGDEAAKLARRLKDMEAKVADMTERWQGIDPDTARAAMEAKDEIERKEYIKKGDIPGLIEVERKKWEASRAEQDEKAKAAMKELEDDLHELLVDDHFTRLATAGKFGEGAEERQIPRVLPEYLEAARALFEKRYKPSVVVEEANGSRKRRPVIMGEGGVQRDMVTALVDEILPSWKTTFCQPPQHVGGKTPDVSPSRSTSTGAPRVYQPDEAHLHISELAEGKAVAPGVSG